MRDIYSSADARHLAQKKLPWMVFDYIDGAAGDEFGEKLNREAIRNIHLQPRVLNNVEHRSLAVSLFGEETRQPFGISPMGMCNLSTPGADLMLARLAAECKIPLGVSTAASTSLEAIIAAAEGNAWFQLYFSGDEKQSNDLLKRAENASYHCLVLTVDVPEVGRRPRELKRGFKMPFRIGPQQALDFALHPRWSLAALYRGRPKLANFGGDFGKFDRASSRAGADWALLQKIRDRWQGKLIVKGVLDTRDALRMKALGVDAIQVSSHGGRQLNSTAPAIHSLRRVREALGSEYPVFYDSGIRSGEDVIKAYAMGADFVFLGRPLLFAMAANKEKGLQQINGVINNEIHITLAQLGVRDMKSVDPSQLSTES